jgi:GNAT superfamily N-acetyltransferase
MITIKRTNSEDKDFIELVRQLDAYLAEMDGEEHAFYAQFNKVNLIQHVIVAYDNDIAVGCGAIKQFDAGVMEVKRMYVDPVKRGNGIATTILAALESWAIELGYTTTVLETGKRQEAAIELYQKNSYHIIESYGQYKNVENSICFEKKLAK